MINTPILLLIFNRPDTTARVFAAIREASPKQLYIAADGPRLERAGEKESTEAVLKIVNQVDWDCEVYTLYRQENLGCGVAVSSAIDWFFTQVERGIILEDDTLPNQSFFKFCEMLLEKYNDDERIAHINGSNFQLGKKWGKASYYFANYPSIWGWATWRRAWQHYDYKLENYHAQETQFLLRERLKAKGEVAYWQKIFQKMHTGFKTGRNVFDTWDYQWIFTCLKNNWLTITPNVNLISNIGFGALATHTKTESIVAGLPAFELKTIYSPDKVIVNKASDRRLFKIYFETPPSMINRIRNLIYKTLPPGIIIQIRQFRRKYFPNIN